MYKRVVFIGATNAGKSSLINALMRKQAAVVGDIDHLTSDIVDHKYKGLIFTDTPGVSKYLELDAVVSKITDVNLFLFVCDQRFDMQFFNLVVKKVSREKLALIINKCDLMREKFHIPNIKTFFVSATNKIGISDLRKYLENNSTEENLDRPVLSILGRSNVGKSTLVNAILGENRFKVKDEIGTTVDIAIESIKHMDIVDTPGYRKGCSSQLAKLVQAKISEHIKLRPFTVGLVVISAVDGFTSIDKFMVNQIINTGFVAVCINKIDLISKEKLIYLTGLITKCFPTVEVFKVSCACNLGIGALKKTIYQKLRRLEVKLKTSILNKAVNEKGELHTIKYITQTGPYTFRVFTRNEMSEAKLKYLEKVILDLMRIKGIRLQFDIN